jgi:hypothetical protein
MAAVLAAGAVVGLLTGALALYDRLFPPETPVKAALTVGANPELNIRAGQWAEDHPSAFEEGFPAYHAGVVYGVHMVASGLDGETPELKWEVQDRFTGQTVAPLAWAPPSMPFTPDDDPWRDTLEVFVPVPPVTRMGVTFTVVHDDHEIATRTTPALDVGGSGR